ncbi:ExeA family protein [Aliikangiella sp. IMCC44359]|uniref:ExeA family protein n=1 Tax=Aliikangiella sp. IMCC44359 TaxID=3459125 RepID=UPI00403A99E1
MYLYRFAMKKLPFGLTPDTELFCPLATHSEAINVLNFALNSGEALIKVVGEVGTGKTMLCRLLINQLLKNRKVAYIPYPKLSARELKFAVARELGIRMTDTCREDQLTQRIQTRLLNLNKKYGSVILVIDEAQQLDKEGLETLRLFTNLETEQHKLLQIVLFGQPELDKTLKFPELRQIQQRIVFSYQLKSLTRQQTHQYVNSRLKAVSNQKTHYTWLANQLVFKYSRGIPRLINILCHKALLLGFGQNNQAITALNLMRAAKDTESINTKIQNNITSILTLFTLFVSGSAMAYWGLT